MKKQLLIASALLTTCGVFAQQPRVPEQATIVRSEEHTSELQSH